MLIDQRDAIVVYYTLPTLSPGVLSEIVYSYTNNKDVYMIFTSFRRISPFLEYFTMKIFYNEDSFFEFLEENTA
ncbi:MAG: hypothetical protein DRJ39_00985 [Thermoprotei archaeon]|nr:MAG: hypothetical protein DRJ39_00985 [Thermoprotei archaeon]